MKSIKNLILVMFVALSTTIFANTEPIDGSDPTGTSEINIELTKEVQTLFKKLKFPFQEELKASVQFTINRENEIVVLDVRSENEHIESFLKRALNYRPLKTMVPKDNLKMYTMNLTLEK